MLAQASDNHTFTALSFANCARLSQLHALSLKRARKRAIRRLLSRALASLDTGAEDTDNPCRGVGVET